MVNVGLVVSTYHTPIADRMEAGAREAADSAGATVIATRYVPGAYDTVLPADRLARRDDVDAVAVLGALITGETDHDQVIAQSVASALLDVSLARDTPVTFGIAGPGMSPEVAAERVDYGANAVESAIDLVEALDD